VPPKKLAIVLALTAVVAGLYFWQDARTRKLEDLLAARELASRDMKAFNEHENDAAFAPKLTTAMAHVNLFSPVRAGDSLTHDVLPVLDEYLDRLHRALESSDAYVALDADAAKEVAPGLAKLHAREIAIRKFRGQLADLAQRASAGKLDLDALSSEMTTIALQITQS